MPKYLFFGRNITPACSCCRHGRRSADKDQILCKKMGVTPLDYACRRFAYAPTKRIPNNEKSLSEHQYSKEDFEL